MESFEIVEFNNALEFLDSCEPLLLSDESFYNLKLGLALAIRENKLEVSSPFFFGIYKGKNLVGCALRTNHDRPIALSRTPKDSIPALINALMDKKVILAGVIGEIEVATHFKNHWASLNNLNSKLNIHLGIYESFSIQRPLLEGQLTVGGENEKEIVCKFIRGFMEDCFPNVSHTDESVEKLCTRHISNKSIYLLKNKSGEIVSMAANTRGSLNGGTVSLVYTPSEHRGQGYGSLVTALVSEIILKEKKFVNLFTDLSNPTSNSIYQKIGYKRIGENIHFDFI